MNWVVLGKLLNSQGLSVLSTGAHLTYLKALGGGLLEIMYANHSAQTPQVAEASSLLLYSSPRLTPGFAFHRFGYP